jgi:hypothetical protein
VGKDLPLPQFAVSSACFNLDIPIVSAFTVDDQTSATVSLIPQASQCHKWADSIRCSETADTANVAELAQCLHESQRKPSAIPMHQPYHVSIFQLPDLSKMDGDTKGFRGLRGKAG